MNPSGFNRVRLRSHSTLLLLLLTFGVAAVFEVAFKLCFIFGIFALARFLNTFLKAFLETGNPRQHWAARGVLWQTLGLLWQTLGLCGKYFVLSTGRVETYPQVFSTIYVYKENSFIASKCKYLVV
jgi:hypothetical protein